MDFAFDQADKKLKKESKQRAQQKQKAAAKRKAAAAKAKKQKAEAEARLAARKAAEEQEDRATGTTAATRARDKLEQQSAAAAVGGGWLDVLDRAQLPPEAKQIEGRAVTLEFLQRLTDRFVSDAMKAKATEEAVAYLESRESRSAQQQRDLDQRKSSPKPFATGRDVHRLSLIHI